MEVLDAIKVLRIHWRIMVRYPKKVLEEKRSSASVGPVLADELVEVGLAEWGLIAAFLDGQCLCDLNALKYWARPHVQKCGVQLLEVGVIDTFGRLRLWGCFRPGSPLGLRRRCLSSHVVVRGRHTDATSVRSRRKG